MIADIRTREELVAKVAEDANDPTHERWSVGQKCRALNNALRLWSQRVQLPRTEVFPVQGGGGDAQEYALPAHVTGFYELYIDRFAGYQRFGLPMVDYIEPGRFERLRTYHEFYDEKGRRVVQLERPLPVRGGRIVWWFPNSQMPSENIFLQAGIEADTTALDISAPPEGIGQAGFIKIDDEWLCYAGIEKLHGNLVLHNLLRGIYNTKPAAHATGANVTWGVAVHREDLYEHLVAEALAYMHLQYLNKASVQERQHHFDQLRYYKQIAEEKWRHVPPNRPIKSLLGRDVTPSMVNRSGILRY